MNIETARAVAIALHAAAAKAQSEGQTEITGLASTQTMRELDGPARAELAAVIEAAEEAQPQS